MPRYFLLSSYETLTCSWLVNALAAHPDIGCWGGMVHGHLTNEKLALLPHTGQDTKSSLDTMFVQASEVARDKKLLGYLGAYTSFVTFERSLSEKTRHPFRKGNLLVHPFVRADTFFRELMGRTASGEHIPLPLGTIEPNRTIQKQLASQGILADASQREIDLFHLALALVQDYDRLDLPTPSRQFRMETLLHDKQALTEMIDYLSHGTVVVNDAYFTQVAPLLDAARANYRTPEMIYESWAPWQRALVERALKRRFSIPYYPHMSPPVFQYYAQEGYQFPFSTSVAQEEKPFLLASFQLNSNRPAQLCAFMDNLEETADDPSCFEIIVNINDNDLHMERVLQEEQKLRPFTLKYIKSPPPPSFCDLWKPLNEIIKHTAPNAYFLINLADEQMFKTKGWDTILKRYVGFFPDHLFRLRTSRNKYRNYFDSWECGYCQDSVIIATKRWLEVGGDWNPCMGPDNFQQFIAFYLWKSGKFTGNQLQRDIPIAEITLGDDSPGMGIDSSAALNRQLGAMKAWFIAQSHGMQQEANRRAMKIKAHISAATMHLSEYKVIDNRRMRQIELRTPGEVKPTLVCSYKLSWIGITTKNIYRRFFFDYYMGVPGKRTLNPLRGLWFYYTASSRLGHNISAISLRVREKINVVKFVCNILFVQGKIREKAVRQKIYNRAFELFKRLPFYNKVVRSFAWLLTALANTLRLLMRIRRTGVHRTFKLALRVVTMPLPKVTRQTRAYMIFDLLIIQGNIRDKQMRQKVYTEAKKRVMRR